MNLSKFSEFDFIQKIKKIFKDKIDDDVIAIGDDCSVIPFDQNHYQLTTTDLLIEGVHFLKDRISPFDLGQKALMVNLSDIAAMGGVPKQFYLSLGIPTATKMNDLDSFLDGIHSVSEKFDLQLMGGDTSKSLHDLIINISLQGLVKKKNLKLRSTAQNSDFICLASEIGDSAIGIEVLLNNIKTSNNDYFLKKHNNPQAQLHEGIFLSDFSQVSSMIDISDGLASDLNHICSLSNLGANVNLQELPLSAPYLKTCDLNQWDLYEKAVCGGEDYQLLFTVKKEGFKNLAKDYYDKFQKKIHIIGEIIPEKKIQFWINDQLSPHSYIGFDHFLKKQNHTDNQNENL